MKVKQFVVFISQLKFFLALDKMSHVHMGQGATAKLPADKVATKQDAEAVGNAEWRNNLNQAPHPGGVVASISAAARLNENLNA